MQVDDESDQYEICTVGEQPGRANKALVNLYDDGPEMKYVFKWTLDPNAIYYR